ncbi:MAG: DUF1593 domain-containing protein [Cytophagales bacterium]|nr:DUF1593 domain-containing protein [Cytophagales bacterium]
MKTYRYRLLLVLLLVLPVCLAAQPRVIISSDFPPLDVIPGGRNEGPPAKRSDPDDVQSMVRFLLYANEFRVEGLIAASATVANVADKQGLLDLLDRYDAVDDNLRRHDNRYPTAAALRKMTTLGLSGTYGQPAGKILGEGKDSEASAFIIRRVDDPNPDPIWFCFWGGSQELAQALWTVQRTRTPEQTARFVRKIRVYLISQQDGTAQWLKIHFPDLFLIESRQAFKGMNNYAPGADTTLGNGAWLRTHVRTGHGPLGAAYPATGWDPDREGVVEGDSPSFLYLLSTRRGLGDAEQPGLGGWGGRFVRDTTGPAHWIDAPEGGAAVTRWQPAYQADFAARLDWCVKSPGEANHPPRPVLNGDPAGAVLTLNAAPGQTLTLSAEGSADPNGHALTYRWWPYPEAGSYRGNVVLPSNPGPKCPFTVPAGADGTDIHLVLEVTDTGMPKLTSYRRVVVRVKK